MSLLSRDDENLLYTYDADANPTLISDNAAGTRTATLQYDALDRLTSAAIAVKNGVRFTS